MRSREWSPRLERQTSLTPRQREQVKAQLQGLAGRDAVSELLERITPTHCSTCRGAHLVRDGQADGLQRFKCRGCAVAFNGLTSTPLPRLRHRQKWLEQAKVLEEGTSVRKAAAR